MTQLEFALSEMLDHTIYLSKRAFKHIQIGTREPQKLCIAPLSIRALHKAHAINILVKEGLFEEAQTILRILIEISFVIRAIKNDESFAFQYGRSAFVQKETYLKNLLKGHRELGEAILTHEKTEQIESLLAKISTYVKRIKAKKITVRDYADASGLLAVYYTVYSDLSSTVHSGPEDVERFFSSDEEFQMLRIGPPKEGRKDVLFWIAIEAMIRILQDSSAVFGCSIIGLEKAVRNYERVSAHLMTEVQNAAQQGAAAP